MIQDAQVKRLRTHLGGGMTLVQAALRTGITVMAAGGKKPKNVTPDDLKELQSEAQLKTFKNLRSRKSDSPALKGHRSGLRLGSQRPTGRVLSSRVRNTLSQDLQQFTSGPVGNKHRRLVLSEPIVIDSHIDN